MSCWVLSVDNIGIYVYTLQLKYTVTIMEQNIYLLFTKIFISALNFTKGINKVNFITNSILNLTQLQTN